MTYTIKNLFGVGSVIIAVIFTIAPTFVSADTLNRQLDLGSTGSDVTALQTFLAKDYSLYPEARITSYFGALTASAVGRFQTRNDIPSVGRVGPITLVALNAQMSGNMSFGVDSSAPTLSVRSVVTNNNSASVSWSTNEMARGIVYYSSSPLMVSETLHAVNINGSSAITDSNLKPSQMISIQNLQPNTTYYYMVYSSDVDNNVSVSWPSTFRTI